MSQAFFSAASQAAWAGRSLVDTSFHEYGDMIVLNPGALATSVAGIDDSQLTGETRRVVNRGTANITLAADDTAAGAKDRFATAFTLAAGKVVTILYNGFKWQPYAEA